MMASYFLWEVKRKKNKRSVYVLELYTKNLNFTFNLNF